MALPSNISCCALGCGRTNSAPLFSESLSKHWFYVLASRYSSPRRRTTWPWAPWNCCDLDNLQVQNISMRFPTDDFGAALNGGHHQRREVGVVGEVHLGAARQEGPDALDAAAERRHVKRSPTQSVPSKVA